MPDKRSYRISLLLMAAGGVLLLVGFALPWATAAIPLAGVDAATREHELSGQSLFPGAAATGWVCLAGVAGVLATRSWGRTIVGVIVALAGLVAVVVACAYALSPQGAIDSAATAIAGSRVSVSGTVTAWWLLGLLGGCLGLMSGAWTAARGRGWPTMGARYERTPRRAASVTPWDAMDKGEDPTDDPRGPSSD